MAQDSATKRTRVSDLWVLRPSHTNVHGARGIAVFANIEGTTVPDDFAEIRAAYSSFCYIYADMILMSELREAAGD